MIIQNLGGWHKDLHCEPNILCPRAETLKSNFIFFAGKYILSEDSSFTSSLSFSNIRYWAFHWDSGPPTIVTLLRRKTSE